MTETGVVALTDSNEVNLKIALTAKLLNPKIKVICRADSHDVEANMASFGTDHIIDPFETFAQYLMSRFRSKKVRESSTVPPAKERQSQETEKQQIDEVALKARKKEAKAQLKAKKKED